MKHSVWIFLMLVIGSCVNEKTKPEATTVPIVNNQINEKPTISTLKLEYKIFAISDSISNKIEGYGYDLYADDKRIIHQPIIPAIAGNNHFSSQEKAERTAVFAIEKMKQTGSLPVLTVEELDSLNVLK